MDSFLLAVFCATMALIAVQYKEVKPHNNPYKYAVKHKRHGQNK